VSVIANHLYIELNSKELRAKVVTAEIEGISATIEVDYFDYQNNMIENHVNHSVVDFLALIISLSHYKDIETPNI